MKKYFLISAVVMITSCGSGSGSSTPGVSSISTSTSSSVSSATSSSVSSSSLSLSSSNSFSSVLISSSSSILSSSSSSILSSSSSSVLSSSSSSVSSSSVAGPVGIKQIIAGPNLVPPGFGSEFVFAKVFPPSIGRNGHIAFSGLADVGLEATSQRRAAVWLGRASNLQLVLREDDSINGIPTPMVFGPTDTSFPVGIPIVSDSGKLAIQIPLKNGVPGAAAIVVHADGVTTNVVYQGQAAVGFPVGVTIDHLDGKPYAFSDAGVVYRANTSTGKNGIWYWDFHTTHLLAASGESSSAYPGCPFTSVFSGDPLINNQGDIVFAQDVERVTWSCPNMALFKWKAGALKALIDNTMVMPGAPETIFEFTAAASSAVGTSSYLLDDSGGVAFAAIMKEGANRYRSHWYKTDNGTLQLVTVAGEKLPLDFVQTLTGNYGNVTGMSTSGHLISNFNASPSSVGAQNQFILRGQPRLSIPYTNLAALGNSQLDLVYSPFTSWMDLGLYSGLLSRLTSSGDVLIHTNTGIWSIPVTGPAIHIADESPYYYGGAWYDAKFANNPWVRRANNFGSGLAAEHSDAREIVSCLGFLGQISSCTFIQSITY